MNGRDERWEEFAVMRTEEVDQSMVRENSREEYLYVMLRNLNFISRIMEVC